MNWYPLLGLLALVYAGLVFWMAIKKPEKLWSIGKIQTIVKLLGEPGIDIFFYVCSSGILAVDFVKFLVCYLTKNNIRPKGSFCLKAKFEGLQTWLTVFSNKHFRQEIRDHHYNGGTSGRIYYLITQ